MESLTSFERDLLSHIASQRTAQLGFLQDLVRLDSRIVDAGRTGQEGPIQAFMAERLAKTADRVDKFEPDHASMRHLPGFNPGHEYQGRPNVVATYRGSGGGRSLILNGHADVVAPGPLERWSSPPFEPRVEGGRLYGRGSTDMKAGLAACVLALEAIKQVGGRLKGDVHLQSVVDEEGGGNGTLACIARGYRADAALIAEPTQLQVHVGNRGALLAEIVVEGVPIHASLKGYGVNAIEKVFRLTQALKELETRWMLSRRHPLFSPPTMNIGEIHGGDGASVVPARCLLRFDVEFLPVEEHDGDQRRVDVDAVRQEVQEWLSLTCAGDEWLREHPVEVRWYQETGAFFTDPDEPVVQTLQSAARDCGRECRIGGFAAGCDGPLLRNLAGIPTVVFGPGTIRQAHTIDEYVELEQYWEAIRSIALFVWRWSGMGS